ncbi:hypothetical protein V8O11_17290 [Erwinia aphidicola]|uniref:hypothetical protein n=1 Tax=Erwinia aphidicola TaxID=68334 RepID=UPI00300C2924
MQQMNIKEENKHWTWQKNEWNEARNWPENIAIDSLARFLPRGNVCGIGVNLNIGLSQHYAISLAGYPAADV